jgi:hypothetical protein
MAEAGSRYPKGRIHQSRWCCLRRCRFRECLFESCVEGCRRKAAGCRYANGSVVVAHTPMPDHADNPSRGVQVVGKSGRVFRCERRQLAFRPTRKTAMIHSPRLVVMFVCGKHSTGVWRFLSCRRLDGNSQISFARGFALWLGSTQVDVAP